MANKYLKGGALNPVWCAEQDAKIAANSFSNSILDLFNLIDMDINLEIADGVTATISNTRRKEERQMCTIIESNDYEAKFNFIKRHSDTPEDLELAKQIIGLK